MTKTCGVEEARQSLPALLDQARHGESTIITRHGLPIAAVVPIDVAHANTRGRTTIGLHALGSSGAGLWSGGDAVAAQRDEWR